MGIILKSIGPITLLNELLMVTSRRLPLVCLPPRMRGFNSKLSLCTIRIALCDRPWINPGRHHCARMLSFFADRNVFDTFK
jgi:hypothetical protein